MVSAIPITPRLLMHESHHARQYEVLGVFFLPIYLWLHARHGYAANPLEREAEACAEQWSSRRRDGRDRPPRGHRSDDAAIAGFGRMQDAAYFAPETLIPAQYIPRMLGDGTSRARGATFWSSPSSTGASSAARCFTGWPMPGSGFSSFLGVDARVRAGRASRAGCTSALRGCWTARPADACRVCSSTW